MGREWLLELLDSPLDDRLVQADTALTALAMPDAESVVNADRAALAAAEQDPEMVGRALAGYRQRQGWTHDDLCCHLIEIVTQDRSEDDSATSGRTDQAVVSVR